MYENRKLKTAINTAKIRIPVSAPVLLFTKAIKGEILPLKKLTIIITIKRINKIIKMPNKDDFISERLNCMWETMHNERYKKSQNMGFLKLSLPTTDKKTALQVCKIWLTWFIKFPDKKSKVGCEEIAWKALLSGKKNHSKENKTSDPNNIGPMPIKKFPAICNGFFLL